MKVIQKKFVTACPIKNVPTTVALMAVLKLTKPLASLIKLSPATICKTLSGNLTRLAMACTATGSVGDTTAANANATEFGNCGINK